MKILMITSAYPAQAGDPRGTFIQVLARALAAEGIEVTVVAPGTPSAPEKEAEDRIEVQRATYWIPRWQGLAVGLGGIVPNLRRRPWLIVQVPFLIGALLWKGWRLARTTDLVHAHWLYPAGIAGVIAARRAGVPLVVTSHGGDLNLSHRWWLLRAMARWVARRASRCVGVSHAMVEEFRRLGVPDDRVVFLPLGVDVKPRDQALAARNEAFDRFRLTRAFRIVYAGSLIPRKSVDTLIEAHHQLEQRGNNIATLIVGTGPEEERLRILVKRRGVRNVIFAGGQPPESVREWIALGDVLVLPSRSEGRGLVLVEAMALGVPVVASDIPGPQELIDAGSNGLLFPPQDPLALADRIERLIREPALRDRLREAGRRYVAAEGLTPEACARRHRTLYRELVGGADGRYSAPHSPTINA